MVPKAWLIWKLWLRLPLWVWGPQFNLRAHINKLGACTLYPSTWGGRDRQILAKSARSMPCERSCIRTSVDSIWRQQLKLHVQMYVNACPHMQQDTLTHTHTYVQKENNPITDLKNKDKNPLWLCKGISSLYYFKLPVLSRRSNDSYLSIFKTHFSFS